MKNASILINLAYLLAIDGMRLQWRTSALCSFSSTQSALTATLLQIPTTKLQLTWLFQVRPEPVS